VTAKDECKKVQNGTRWRAVAKSRHQGGQVATDKAIKDFFSTNHTKEY